MKVSPGQVLCTQYGKRWRIFQRLAIVMLMSMATSVTAQDWPFELWHDGKIVLLEGDTLKGPVKYDLSQDILQLNLHNKIEAYSARKVLFFEIFDITVHRYRQFFALPFTSPAGYRAPVFFELLEEGKMTLLAREALESKSYSSPYYYGGSYSRLVLVYKYFFMSDDGTIEAFTGNKNDLLDKMGKQAPDVEKYIKDNRLKYDDKYDFAKIVAYYNSLHGT
jgi:hypothetical protein